MTEREVLNLIKLKKDRLTLAQRYKKAFTEKLGVKGYEEFINDELEDLKKLLELHKKSKNAKDKY